MFQRNGLIHLDGGFYMAETVLRTENSSRAFFSEAAGKEMKAIRMKRKAEYDNLKKLLRIL